MYTSNDNKLGMMVSNDPIKRVLGKTNIIPLGYFLYEGYNLETSCGVETAGGFVQEQDFGSSNELACNTDSAFLSATDTFPNRGSDNTIRLLSQTKGLDKSINPSHPFRLCQGAAQESEDPKVMWSFLLLVSKSCSEMHRLTHCQRPNKCIILLDIGSQASKSAKRRIVAVHNSGSIDLCSR